jgi:hypothetical protein
MLKLRKLTEEEKQKSLYVINDFFAIYFPDKSPDSEYITEYDILMKKKEEEYKLRLLRDNTPSEIDALMESCDNYIKEKNEPNETGFTAFSFIMTYDMWLNKYHGWPVMHNPEWEE